MHFLIGVVSLLGASVLALAVVGSIQSGRIYWKPRVLRRSTNRSRFMVAVVVYFLMAIVWAMLGVVHLANSF
jgi:hypothetical protein